MVATADPVVAADRVDQLPDLVGLQMACQGTGTSLCNPRNAERQVVLDPAGREQEAEDAAQTCCLVVEAAGGPARCRVRRIEEAHDVVARDDVQVAGRRAETESQEAPQDAPPDRNGLGAQPPLATQPVAIRQAQLVKRTGCRGCGGRRRRHHAGIDEMLDESGDVSLPLPSRRKFTAGLPGVEPTDLNLCAEPIDRALVVADCPCCVAAVAEFRQERVTVGRQPTDALGC